MSAGGKPVLLFLDGHASRWSVKALLYLRENNVFVFCVPSHTTIWSQPNDAGPNASFHVRASSCALILFDLQSDRHLIVIRPPSDPSPLTPSSSFPFTPPTSPLTARFTGLPEVGGWARGMCCRGVQRWRRLQQGLSRCVHRMEDAARQGPDAVPLQHHHVRMVQGGPWQRAGQGLRDVDGINQELWRWLDAGHGPAGRVPRAAGAPAAAAGGRGRHSSHRWLGGRPWSG